MIATWRVSAAVLLAGQLVAGGPAEAASLALPRNAPAPLLVQVQDQGTHRMSRLWQNRSIIENALRAPSPEEVLEVEPALPQPRVLKAPEAELEPELETEPEPEPETQVAAEAEERVSCDAAADIVRDYGFSDVRSAGCAGEVYEFSATRDGTAYSIGVAAASGEIAEVKRQ